MSTTPSAATQLSLAAIKERQQATWASGDYGAVAARIVLVSEQLCDTADLRAGWQVLDVATGTGNAAIAAARHGATAVGVDYVGALLDRGRARAAAEGLDVAFVEGDAEDLPFDDSTFDAVTSVFGAMFAPDHARTAEELVRVTKPGGTIALASWTPDSFVADMFRVVSQHVPPPAGLESPMLWGAEAHLRELFDGRIARFSGRRRTFTFRFRTPEEFAAFFRQAYGPTLKAFAALDVDARAALERDLVELARRSNRLDGEAVALPATYLETVARTR